MERKTLDGRLQNQTFQHLGIHRDGTRANSREDNNESRNTPAQVERPEDNDDNERLGEKPSNRRKGSVAPQAWELRWEKNTLSNAGALPGQKVQKENFADSQRRVSFQVRSKSGPCGPDVHGAADDTDFSRDRLDLAHVVRWPFEILPLGELSN